MAIIDNIKTVNNNSLIGFGNIDITSQIFPVGSIITYAGREAPEGWFICDGRAISRTTYANLFTVISTVYGAGDGSTTFQIPETRGLFIRGWIGNRSDIPTQTGRSMGSTEDDMIKKHTHQYNDETYTYNANGGNGPLNVGATTTSTTSSGNNLGDETRPKNITMNYIIKY